jgi:hypothetical protein
MLRWLRRRREFKQAVEAEIERLIARHGEHAFEVAYSRARERVQTEEDRRFNQAVRREFAKRLGITYGLDTATRMLMRDEPSVGGKVVFEDDGAGLSEDGVLRGLPSEARLDSGRSLDRGLGPRQEHAVERK